MTWQCYGLTYALDSPLHVGYHKIGNVQRTRTYVLARNLWGAVTERLARGGFSLPDAPQGDYHAIGQWVQEHCAFTYFFVWDGQVLFWPRYTQEGLRYGDLDEYAFERRFLFAYVNTALDAVTTSAQGGSLHEVEIIAARDHAGNPVQIRGWIFLKDEARRRQDELFSFLEQLQVGGERRYGFGRLRLKASVESVPDGYHVALDVSRPQIQVRQDEPLLAHVLARGIDACGRIEPLVGRQTSRDSQSFGRKLTQAKICWAPGSMALRDQAFQLEKDGVWQKVGSN